MALANLDFETLMALLGSLSWREILIALIALLVLYVLVVSLRMWRLRREKNALDLRTQLATQSAVAAYAAVQEPALQSEPETSSPTEPVFAWNEPPPEFPGQQRIETLERAITQLRNEINELRAELQTLRDASRRELSQAHATQNISPLYSDAMQMALQKHDAASIAERCGIARAEAELVVALVRNRHSAD
jgi:hypothetical protein